MPIISVIVPIYNVEYYLYRCVDSVLAQTFTDFELILVDDGSPDNCGNICDEYAEKDNRIYVIHKKNGGLSDARNAGLDVAKGDYIIFVDSDDYIESDLLEKAVSVLKKHPEALVCYGILFENELGDIMSSYMGFAPEYIELRSNKAKARFICNELTDYRLPWNSQMKVFRRDIIERYNIRFIDNKQIFAEDYCFSLFYFAFVDEIFNIQSKPMYHYMQRSTSIMGNDIKKLNTSRFEKLSNAVKSFYKLSNDTKFLIRYFPLIYYKVINHSIECDLRLFPNSDNNTLKEIIGSIDDINAFYQNIKTAWRKRRLLFNDYSPKYFHEEKLSKLIFLCDNRKLSYRIRNRIIAFRYKK